MLFKSNGIWFFSQISPFMGKVNLHKAFQNYRYTLYQRNSGRLGTQKLELLNQTNSHFTDGKVQSEGGSDLSNVIQGSLVADLGLETGLPTQVLDPFFSTWTPFQFLSWKAEVHRTKLSFLDPLMFLQCVCVCMCVFSCSVVSSSL